MEQGRKKRGGERNWLLFQLLFILALSVVARSPVDRRPKDLPIPQEIPAQIGLGWQLFEFADVGEPSTAYFTVDDTETLLVRITDFACVGDQFEVFVDHVSIGLTSPTFFDLCNTTTSDPSVAYFSSDSWSHLYFTLPPGSHRVEMIAVASPYYHGQGAIRFDYDTF